MQRNSTLLDEFLGLSRCRECVSTHLEEFSGRSKRMRQMFASELGRAIRFGLSVGMSY